jgi:hypothetical protein
MWKTIYRVTGLTALVLTTAACAPRFTEFSEINADKTAYLQQTFASQGIPPEVSAKLPKAGVTQANFASIVVRARSVYVASDKTENRSIVHRFENAGNGLIREMSEFSANDIPYRLYFSVGYGGLLPLKTQIANYRSKYADMVLLTDQIDTLSGDLSTLKENDVFEAQWKMRSDFPNARPHKQSIRCKAGQTFPAANLSANLKGDAQYLLCDRYRDDILGYKNKFAWLKKYGVAITLEHSASNYTVTDTITEVTVN